MKGTIRAPGIIVYRVKEIKDKIVDPEYNNLTLISIAYECGFNSKPTFNEVFKQFENMTH